MRIRGCRGEGERDRIEGRVDRLVTRGRVRDARTVIGGGFVCAWRSCCMRFGKGDKANCRLQAWKKDTVERRCGDWFFTISWQIDWCSMAATVASELNTLGLV